MKKFLAHHNLTENGGRVASRKRERPARKIIEPVVPHGFPIILANKGRFFMVITGREKINRGRGRLMS